MLYYLLLLSTLTVSYLKEHKFCVDVVHLTSYDQYDVIKTRMASNKTSVIFSTLARTETSRKDANKTLHIVKNLSAVLESLHVDKPMKFPKLTRIFFARFIF